MPITLPSAAVRAGTVAHFAAATPPTGWLACTGAAVPRSLYGALFLAIGTTYGAGDGSTTFNLPDLRGEFLRGHDAGRGVDIGRGIGTSQTDQIQNIIGELGFHGGGIGTALASTSGAFTTSVPQPNQFHANSPAAGADSVAVTTFNAGNVVRAGTETRPRNIAMLACIKF